MSKRARKRLAHKEKRVERRDKMLKHDFSSERATLEEVFDQATLMVIYDFLKSGVLYEVHGVVNAGKEARVYLGKSTEGKDLAIKIYLTASAEFRKGMLKYIEGDYRFRSVKRDTRSLIYTWAQKEFRNLQQAFYAKVRVPEPIAVKDNVLVMEFIGEKGVRAPSLKEQLPKKPSKVYDQILKYLARLYSEAKLVHGDLSEYNIMLWRGNPVIFDMAQAVPLTHPMAESFLRRDITNLNRYFSHLGVEASSIKEIYKRIAS
jgi:RIO kinase 1